MISKLLVSCTKLSNVPRLGCFYWFVETSTFTLLCSLFCGSTRFCPSQNLSPINSFFKMNISEHNFLVNSFLTAPFVLLSFKVFSFNWSGPGCYILFFLAFFRHNSWEAYWTEASPDLCGWELKLTVTTELVYRTRGNENQTTSYSYSWREPILPSICPSRRCLTQIHRPIKLI